MPLSEYWALPWVLETVKRIDPVSILDFGVGMGSYGFTIRQALEVGRRLLTPTEWKKRIIGVEIFGAYHNPIWDYYYNEVLVEDGCAFLERTTDASFDAALLCDVLEHFPREKALAVLAQLRRVASWVLVTTPNGRFPQGAWFGNEAERHLSEWRPEDLMALGAQCVPIKRTFLAVFAPNREAARSLEMDDFPVLMRNRGWSLIRAGLRRVPGMLRKRLGLKSRGSY
jgi:hypothetical protein